MNSVKPAEVLPCVPHLCSSLYNIHLLEYAMSAMRVPVGLCLMQPPPPYDPFTTTQEQLLEGLRNSYMKMIFMLNDSQATDRERLMVQGYASLLYLEKWLPPIKHHQIVKMPCPNQKMDHKDYIFLMNDCEGKYSDLDDFLFFTKEENRQKFQSYFFKKYPSKSSIRRNQIL